MEQGMEWSLGRKALACLLAAAVGLMVPLPRQEAVAAEGLSAGQVALEAAEEPAVEDHAGEAESAQDTLDLIDKLAGESDPDLSEKYVADGVFEDRIGIRWVYQVRENGTCNISGRQNSPELDGENWVIPETIVDETGSHTVTSMVGSTMGPGNWYFNGGNANSITFPATIKRMADTWGQSFLTSLCFSGYGNADGKVFFLGHVPADINWERDIASSDLKMKIYTPYPDEWQKTVPTYWSKTQFVEYIPPTGFYPAVNVEGQDAPQKIERGATIEIPVGGGKLVHVVNEPALEAGQSFYKWHSNITWTSDYDCVSTYNQNGWLWALRGAKEGEVATITMENGLFQSYQFKVKIVAAEKDPEALDANNVRWRFRENDDEASIPGVGKTATLTGLVNKEQFSGKDLIVPSTIEEDGMVYEVTRIYGNDYYGTDESIFEAVYAKSVTFPATIRGIDDQSTRFFYNMIQEGGKIFFLGKCPAIDWESITGDRGPSGLVVRSVQEWKDAGCPWYGSYAFDMEEYEGPEGLEVQRDGAVVGAVSLPIGTSVQLDAVSTPADPNYYGGHVAVRWASDNDQVKVSDSGVVTAGEGATAGAKATLTVTSALGYEATCEVELGAAPFKADIAGCTVSLADGFRVYKAKQNVFFPSFTVTDGAKRLVEGEDFTVSYKTADGSETVGESDLVNGNYKLVLTGAGLWYEGSKEIGFTVVKDRVPVAGWDYSVEGGDITVNAYVGDEAGTVVVPAFIGDKRVTKVAANAFDGKDVATVVVPDSVTDMGATGGAVGAVRFMGAVPAGFAAGAGVEAFAGAAVVPATPWKYYLKLDLRGNATGVLGSAAAQPTSACQKASKADEDFALPIEIDGVSLSVIGARALASDASDGALLDFNVIKVPAQFAEVQDAAFDGLSASLVFEGAAPEKTGSVAVSSSGSAFGIPNPEILYPQGADGWAAATDYSGNNWARNFDRGSYDPRYGFTFVKDEVGSGKDAYITGYDGVPRGVWMFPYYGKLSQVDCSIGNQQLGGFKDAGIDASRLTQISMPRTVDQIIGNAFKNINPDQCDEIFFAPLINQKVPTATDYDNAFTVKEGADKSKLTITCPAANYQAWKNSEWAKHYNIKIHMVSSPSLFDFEEVTITHSNGEKEDALAVTGYHGIENSVAIPSYVDGLVRDGKTYSGPVVAISEGAFEESDVVAVNVPSSVEIIGGYAFHNSAVSYVNLEEGVKTIGTWCFWGCSALKEITLPSSLMQVGEAPFGVSGLQNVFVNDGSEFFKDIDGVLYTADPATQKLVYYPLARPEREYQVAEGTKSVGQFAFRGASDTYVSAYALEKIVLPASLTEIEKLAFQQLDELREIAIPDSVSRIGEYAFQSCNNLESVNIPANAELTSLSEGVFEFCGSLEKVVVPTNIREIGEEAFYSLDSLQEVALPEGLERIGVRAFGACPRLSTINLPHSLKRIEGSAFISDVQIRSLGLGDTSLEYIGDGAFGNLINVTEPLVIPATVKHLGVGAFSGMHYVRRVEFADGFSMKELGEGVFGNMSSLEWITIPACVEKVGAFLFFETAVQRTNDTKFHVVFLNQGEWECDDDQTTFSHYDDTILQGYVYGYATSSTKRNISDSDGNVLTGLYWKPIDIDVSSEWTDTTYAEPGKEFRLAVSAKTANGDLSYAWKVDGEPVEDMTGEVFTCTFANKARHLVSVDIFNSMDPANPKTVATTVDVTDPGDVKYSLTRARIDAIPVQMWSSGQVKPKPRVTYEGTVLKEGTDYTLSYADNAGVGTGKVFIEGKGRYTNIVSATFTIVGATQSALIDAIAAAKVDRCGVAISGDGFGLAAGTWYAPQDKASVLDAAIQSATAVALASKPAKSKIEAAAKALQQAQAAFDAAKVRATGDEKPGVQGAQVSVGTQVYTGGAIEPAVVVKREGKTLANGIDYTVRFLNNSSVGTASAVITGAGSYVGTKTVTFEIVPKGTKLTKAAGKKGSLVLKWKKQASQTSGYEVMYATNAKFSGAKTVKMAGASKVGATLKALKAKTKYYVKVRTYKTVGGKAYCSSWSAVKSVKTK